MGNSDSQNAHRVFDHYYEEYVDIPEETMRRNREFTAEILQEFLKFIWRKYNLQGPAHYERLKTNRETLNEIMEEFVHAVNSRQIQIRYVTQIERPVTGTKIVAYKRAFEPYGLSIDVSTVIREG